MNELMISYSNGNYIYFRTNSITVNDAYGEYVQKCEQVGINIDNMRPTEMVLRNEDYREISQWIMM